MRESVVQVEIPVSTVSSVIMHLSLFLGGDACIWWCEAGFTDQQIYRSKDESDALAAMHRFARRAFRDFHTL